MSLERRSTTNKQGDPVLVITIVGSHDISSLRRSMTPARFDALAEFLGAPRVIRHAKQRVGGL